MSIKKPIQFLKKNFSLNQVLQINNNSPNKNFKIHLERMKQKSLGMNDLHYIEKFNQNNLIMPNKLIKKHSNINYSISTRNKNFENKRDSILFSINKLNLSKINLQNNNFPKTNRFNSSSKDSTDNSNDLGHILKLRLSSNKKKRRMLSPLSFSNFSSLNGSQSNINLNINSIVNPEDLHIFNVFLIQKTKKLKYEFDNIENET
jgi:hypothetical protein